MTQQARSRRRFPNPAPREFIAAVRLEDGRRELYRIPAVRDAEEARRVVLDQLFAVVSVVVTPRH
ncbi:hypothetical protein [Azovibrio restrictus]|jgi:hypothetical protein|uniref:hypothetical protein n=1 Tax=Azovibrio restrictus TaxID=146938 RepID=UPI0026F12CCE|nr:hypothetical protein [Azovibrio restrictus]